MAAQSSELLLLFIAVFLGSLLGTALMRRLAGKYGWTVLPREDRWHRNPTALHGGVGFYPFFLWGGLWVLLLRFGGEWSELGSLDGIPKELALAAALLVGSLLMFLFGLCDDLKQFRPSTKLLCQLITASLFIFAGGVFPLTGIHIVDILVTYFWFVGITNAVNMLDNMDGLASGVVILAGTTLVILAMQAHGLAGSGSLAVILGLIFVAALLGFWIHNRPPATIFMGDSGSLFLGYVLAAMAIPSSLNGFLGISTWESTWGSVLALMIPATVLAVPIFDTTLVAITRKWRAEKASQGGRDHSSHRLVGLGLSEKKTVWVLYSFAAVGGIVAVLMQRFPDQSLPLLGGFLLVLVFSGVYLGHVKVQTAEPNRMPPAWTPLVSELLYKRRVAEVLLDTMLIVLCFYGAYLLRFEGVLSAPTKQALVTSLPVIVASCLVTYWGAGIYRGQWRLIAVSDIPSCAVGVFGGAALSLAVVTLVTRFESGHSRSAYIIFALLLFIAFVGSRLSFQLLDSVLLQNGSNGSDARNGGLKPVLIYGAGKGGKILHDEVRSNLEMKDYSVLGFIDDDPNQVGRKLCGLPIKTELEWRREIYNCTPEIWVSSRFIPDELAQQVAYQWKSRLTVRRLRLQVGPVGGPGEAGVHCAEEFLASGDSKAVIKQLREVVPTYRARQD